MGNTKNLNLKKGKEISPLALCLCECGIGYNNYYTTTIKTIHPHQKLFFSESHDELSLF